MMTFNSMLIQSVLSQKNVRPSVDPQERARIYFYNEEFDPGSG